ncbi:hypothetical protein K466DRAFT_589387 [Polyporus arcularius HHB13444]|uniref:Cysteine-rich protein 1 n=1 Tax=Polyporus arcularius HHB13444 TaxID=1314778 RepID=A0A5C3P2I2_9APHY|nr:hypothetical protein K466DRAFT_589387 [Polyporus arcularius HHB13444]
MHPFGGSPRCPRCSTAVYAAEQIMGPGRKLYHKSCLKCTSCNKRLDSFSLVEHEEEPYCKLCHVKLFGTRDLRHGNLYQASPNRAASPPPRSSTASDLAQPLPVRRHMTGSAAIESSRTKATSPPPMPLGLLRPNRALSPSKEMGSGSLALTALDNLLEDFDGVEIVTPVHANEDTAAGASSSQSAANGARAASPPVASPPTRTVPVPLAPSATGTRYGAALGGAAPAAAAPLAPMMTGRQWGGAGATPKCPACAKSVYFAEQVKAVGKTWHKWCLRCQGCEKTLDTGRLVDKDGSPFCGTCYTKNFGPAGSGYALLGKAGG